MLPYLIGWHLNIISDCEVGSRVLITSAGTRTSSISEVVVDPLIDNDQSTFVETDNWIEFTISPIQIVTQVLLMTPVNDVTANNAKITICTIHGDEKEFGNVTFTEGSSVATVALDRYKIRRTEEIRISHTTPFKIAELRICAIQLIRKFFVGNSICLCVCVCVTKTITFI